MLPRAIFSVVGLLVFVGLAACAGSGVSAPPGARNDAAGTSRTTAAASGTATQSIDVAVGPTASTATFALAPGANGSITLHARSSHATLKIGADLTASPVRAAARSQGACTPVPAIPPIVITNPLPFPITVNIDRFAVRLPCSVNGLLFGASVYQSNPLPPMLVSTKLGDATGSGNVITFTPAVSELTFPAQTALTISILPETSTAFTQLPALANAMTSLTSNAPAVPNSLALLAPAVQGGTTFQSACYLPADPAGPGLGGIHILGIAAFYCVLVPGQTGVSTTFGSAGASNAVTFTLGPNAKPDLSYVGLDGPPIFAPCAPKAGGQVCASPAFSLPVYSTAIVGNVAALAVCVPAVSKTDCNGVAGNQKAPSATKIASHHRVQLLFADDPTYNAGNTFGGVTLQVTGSWPACAIDTGRDADNDAPPGYADPGPPAGATPSDADYAGAGPYVEFDLITGGPGTCALQLTEDTGLLRTFDFQIPVTSSW